MDYKIKHLMYVPFTGLGLYNGYRGDRWLRNRIKIFKQFVVPSLLNQSNQNFSIWVSWRKEEWDNHQVHDLRHYLERLFPKRVVFTFSGVCFWDDKYDDFTAHERLVDAVHGAMGPLINHIGECTHVLMTLQPSDDCYHKDAVDSIQNEFERDAEVQALGFTEGYVCAYQTMQLAEWNPKTNPPFFTIKFPRETFIDPLKHIFYTGPYKSHEYIGDELMFGELMGRGFLVGTHGENISTVFDHPYAKALNPVLVEGSILKDFGIDITNPLVLPVSLRKWAFNKLPYRAKRKLRYWAEKNRLAGSIYNFIRS